MPVVVAEGVVEVTADANAVPRQVAKDVENGQAPVRAAGAMTGSSIVTGIMTSLVVLKAVDWFGGAITGASDLAETVNKSNTIFGTAAKVVEVWGDKATVNLGLSKAAALQAASGFGNMFTQLGYTSAAAADLSTKTVQMAADLGSFNNIPTADVADRISAALRGEYDSLQALIPNINAARVEREALTMTGKASAAQLTAQEKAAATLAIVERDGAAAMGDYARTSDEFANSSKTVTAEMEEMQAEVGTALLPVLKEMLGFVKQSVIPGFKGVAEWVGKNTDTFFGLVAVLGITTAAYVLGTIFGTAYTAYQTAAAAATGGLTVAQWALNAAMNANPIGAIITVIGLLVGVIVWVATQTTFFQDVWAGLTSFLGEAWIWLWGILEPIFTQIGVIFTWLWEYVIGPTIGLIIGYIQVWGAVFTWLYENVLHPMFTAAMVIIGVFAGIVVLLWENAISPTIGFIAAGFTWLYENVIVPTVNLIIGYVQVWGAIFGWLYDTVIAPTFALIGIAFNWVWANVISPVAGFIMGAISAIGGTVNSVFGGIADFIGSAFTAALGMVKTPLNGIISLVNNAITALNSLKVTIPDWVPEVGGQTWGLNLPKIPMLARGSRNAPDTFIAGENGPELITGAGGARVYSNNETRDMLTGSGGGGIYIGSVTIDAKNVREFSDVIDMVKALPQVARTGRGQVRMGY